MRFRLLVLLIVASWLGTGAAHAEKRVALVMGNSAYKNVARLANPANDAALVGGMFRKAGFDIVDIKLDLTGSEMRKALREFGGKVRDAGVAVVYYAGHGIELDGVNYLIPTDATLETDSDVLDETIALDRALFAVEPAKQLRLIILDACRDNPFAKTMKRTIASRAIGRGLAKVEPTSPNTMIAFAAKAGSTASDGDTKNSPFATALVERLPTPGLDLGKAFRFVRDDVLKSTGNKQEPFVYGSLGGDDVALVPAKPAAAPGPQADARDGVRRDYELALQAGNRDAWEAFLQAYPDGFYAGLARAQLKNVAAEEARAAAAAKARQAEDEKARLAAERANKAEQEKAAAAAKAAENARLAAEKAKQIEEAKAAAAEQRRKDAEAAAKALADKHATEKALAEKIANDKAAAELAAKQANDNAQGEQKVAAITPTQSSPSLSPQETAKLVQSELRRVGCLAASADGDWNASSQRSLTLFNKYAGTKLDAKLASFEALDAIKAKPGRVCPLVCDHGFKADGDTCVKIACRAGYRVNDDNECEKVPDKKPVATREDSRRRDTERKQTEATPAKPQSSGQMVCASGICRPVRSGCRLETTSSGSGFRNVEICN
ncbi:caspase (peptidase) [Bradyrhizobium sp. WBOS7]|uniref:Caspase (Peptidase) n=1 Tax=Bradyrhizobium betae TaxID=244734 RepID=A0AAE9NBH6_9BRAD|nr:MULTISPECIES: caspase family protein [Bradyrhizobium]MDD1568960.1 caspase (peptidase) [Bradyrhizobium sp. WBOS1]UUO37783.1 caspase (peptidase) [Bradyrhizobium sp. WBOS01]MDD1527265.1 caspase (peptidase) [Bradyrhizobium sp. WBOS2]MDD1576079.1 caspase (peptidase) [Bradyrhizobium sp. WBOS7]MDD1603344.1 caspase (peptidase) [Bradyrhizobium sp. WBOS16]